MLLADSSVSSLKAKSWNKITRLLSWCCWLIAFACLKEWKFYCLPSKASQLVYQPQLDHYCLNPKGMGKKEDPRFDCSNQWHLHEDLVEWGVHLPHELRERVQLVG